MNKWILISICNGELEPIRVFGTFEEAQAAMKADFIDAIGTEEFNQVCTANGEPYCDDWRLRDDNAWSYNGDSVGYALILMVTMKMALIHLDWFQGTVKFFQRFGRSSNSNHHHIPTLNCITYSVSRTPVCLKAVIPYLREMTRFCGSSHMIYSKFSGNLGNRLHHAPNW